jgi:hypothetical protein
VKKTRQNLELGSDPIRPELRPRKLQNFSRRSYRFARAPHVFHVPDASSHVTDDVLAYPTLRECAADTITVN